MAKIRGDAYPIDREVSSETFTHEATCTSIHEEIVDIVCAEICAHTIEIMDIVRTEI